VPGAFPSLVRFDDLGLLPFVRCNGPGLKVFGIGPSEKNRRLSLDAPLRKGGLCFPLPRVSQATGFLQVTGTGNENWNVHFSPYPRTGLHPPIISRPRDFFSFFSKTCLSITHSQIILFRGLGESFRLTSYCASSSTVVVVCHHKSCLSQKLFGPPRGSLFFLPRIPPSGHP